MVYQTARAPKLFSKRKRELFRSGMRYYKGTVWADGCPLLGCPRSCQGGDLGWRNILELNPVFADALNEAERNTLIGPIQSPGGFHLIAVRDRRGDQSVVVTEYKTRHILIKPDAVRSLEKAKELAQNIRREITSGADFADLARRFSEDPLSAPKVAV